MADLTVVYHFDEPKTIQVDILVPAEGQIIAALPVLPQGDGWAVTWHLKGDGVNAPFFDGGIELDPGHPTPDGLHILPSPDNVSGTPSFTVNLDNACLFNHNVHYLISANRGNADFDKILRENFLHDPTISVVTDPPRD